MTILVWVLLAASAVLFLGQVFALGRRPAPEPCHLLTARQLADELGVSLAAVQTWQAEGLVPSIACDGCSGTIPLDVLARLRVLPPEVLRSDELAAPVLAGEISAERRGAEAGGWVAMSRSRWPS